MAFKIIIAIDLVIIISSVYFIRRYLKLIKEDVFVKIKKSYHKKNL